MIALKLIERASGVTLILDADITTVGRSVGAWTLVARLDGGSARAVQRLTQKFHKPTRLLTVPRGLLTWENLVKSWRQQEEPGAIIACGGGTILDAAKAFRLMDARRRTTLPEPKALTTSLSARPLYCVPTTCGSGSELTETVSLWDGGRKRSLEGLALRPTHAIYSANLVGPLWDHIAIAAYWDAVSHSLESLWSHGADAQSSELALLGLAELMRNVPDDASWASLQRGAAASAAAISLTRTGIAHALSYPLTLKTGCPHGLAAGLWAVAFTRFMTSRSRRLRDAVNKALGRSPADTVLTERWRRTGASRLAASHIRGKDIAAISIDGLDPLRGRASLFLPNATEFECIRNLAISLLEEGA